jgi:hypothetical protein
VDRTEEESFTAIEDGFSPIAMMGVEIPDRDPLRTAGASAI